MPVTLTLVINCIVLIKGNCNGVVRTGWCFIVSIHCLSNVGQVRIEKQRKSNQIPVSLFSITSPIPSPVSTQPHTYHSTQEVGLTNMNVVQNVQGQNNILYVPKLFCSPDQIYPYLNSTCVGDAIPCSSQLQV